MDPARSSAVMVPPAFKGEFRSVAMDPGQSSASMAPKEPYRDIELGYDRPPLYPYIAPDENAMRWAFIRKVYSILSLQLILTAAVAGVVAFYHPVAHFLVRTPGLVIAMAILPFILLCPLYYYRQKHPINILLLALFTASLSLTIGMACAFTEGKVIWESALLTTVVVVCLTLYTFWAARRGHDFSFLGPILFTSLIVFFPLGRLSYMIYGGIASLIFSGFIVYDTDNLIKRYTYDQYIWASVSLYLDIINLFLSLLTLFRASSS